MTKKIALLIGVSEYESTLNPLPSAVKDVKAMQRVLQNSKIGGFDEVKILPNPDTHTMQLEIETFFSGRNKEDILLLYFSGHGIKDENGRFYFSTRITRTNLKHQLIKSTAVAASFVHDQMNNSRSKRQVIILDCCFSAAFDPSLIAKDDGSVDLQGQLGAEGRVVLASSSSTQYSFEQQGSDISVYTGYLVEGIETGAGDLDQDGKISARELHKYACERLEDNAFSMKPKIIVLKDEGFDVVIAQTQNKTTKHNLEDIQNNNWGEVRLGTAKLSGDIYKLDAPTFQLRNFLEPYEDFITNLIQQFTNLANESLNISSDITNQLLNIIKQTSEADFVFILTIDNKDNWSVKAHSNPSKDIDNSFYFNTLNSHILPTVSRLSIFNPAYHGIYRLHEDKNGVIKAFVFVPLKGLPQAEVIVVCGIHQDSYLMGDVYGRILTSFYNAYQKLSLKPALVEAAIIDDLKKDFGFVAAHLYERRFQLFCDRLQRMIVYFEPVLHLDADELFISSWEALARDPETLTAPVDLFQAAEMWGPRFTIELDQYFLRTATASYQEARKKSKQNRSEETAPLSVNVYPDSLIRTAYFETVRQVIKEKAISPRNLILEISEKAELPQFNDGSRLQTPLTFFKAKLVEYVKQLQIRFAIDDFGVGYASVSRLAGLHPSHVKIDRNILYHQSCDVIIRFVHELVGANNLNPSHVIVEGIDETTPITLYSLKQLGVNYIQGHIVGKPSPEIYRLSKEKYDDLKKLILEKPN
ncbi:MAG: EAL domain-containing protein [Aulosira sp. DedQUE10]|nr:EAL domain-containing protein [Aulosira sp. DedQUE10]